MTGPQDPAPNMISDDELLAAIRRDLRSIYSDVLREPLPEKLAAVLLRLELQSCVSPPEASSVRLPRSSGSR